MKLDRLRAVAMLDFVQTLKRPMMLILLLMLAFFTWGLSTGNLQISSGTTTVGGKRAWINSEFSIAFGVTLFTSFLYTFFASIVAVMALVRDDEAKISELLRSTRLRASEYVWGKALAVMAVFFLVAGVQTLLMIFFYDVLPNAQADEIRGPFALGNYLRPLLVFALPTLAFYVGLTFYIGARWRRPILGFLFPIALISLGAFFLWNWSPTWLDPALNRLLMWLDPAGMRWLNETWLKVDRGVDFYNTSRVALDVPFLLSRLAFLGLGFVAILLAQRSVGRTAAATKRPWKTRRREAAPTPERTSSAVPLVMGSRPPGWLAATREIARLDSSRLLREPGVLLFSFFVLVQTLGSTLVSVGAFETRLLLTPGQIAAGSFNTLTLLVCLLMMFFLAESLEADQAAGARPLIHSSAVSNVSLVAGRILGNSGIGAFVLVAVFLGGLIALLVQAKVPFSLAPYLLIWGLLLVPTFLLWSSFIAAVQAIGANRYLTYGVGLAVVATTLYRQAIGELTWVGNWMLWNIVRWSDISVLELDRRALLLNRGFALALAAFFFFLAVRFFRRQENDAAQTVHRLRPRALGRFALRLAPVAALPLVVGVMLWLAVQEGHAGEQAQEKAKDYWKQNLETWVDAPQPEIAAVDLELDLEPAESRFETRGSFELVHPRGEPLRRFAVTGGDHWRDVEWRLGGEPKEPEERSGLYVFELERSLAAGERLELGFSFHGRWPDGISEQGGGMPEFILPSGVVLTSFSPSFVPVMGYNESRGVDDDNRTDPPIYDDDFHEDLLPPAIGSAQPFSTRIRITIPEAFTVNSVGSLVEESVENGRRTALWVSDHPVRFFNVVAGRWKERRGEGTVIYYHPKHAYNLDEMSRALEGSRRWFSEWFYPFPWQELKLSEFANLAGYAQGFPTNITFSEGIGFLTRGDEKANAVLMVTAHEAAHQWWGNLLTPGDGPGGNVLSEGMAHFSTALLVEQLEGEAARMEFLKRIEERYGNGRRRDAERPLVKLDGRQPGDTTATYDKGGWVAWMLLQHLGRDTMLGGLRQFIEHYQSGPDFPLLEDLIAELKPLAEDGEAYDRFVEQWFFDVVIPEYRLSDAVSERRGEGWATRVRVENAGSGSMPIEVAAIRGERFSEDAEETPYADARTSLWLAAGESETIEIISSFEPRRVVVDPDVLVFQLQRKLAVVEL